MIEEHDLAPEIAPFTTSPDGDFLMSGVDGGNRKPYDRNVFMVGKGKRLGVQAQMCLHGEQTECLMCTVADLTAYYRHNQNMHRR